MDVVIVGNVALDVICKTVEDVPRHASIGFEQVSVSPGGCGSNVAIGLRHLGWDTALVARVGVDETGEMLERHWSRLGMDLRYLRREPSLPTGVSIGLVDHQLQPRFLHTPGASSLLTVADLDPPAYRRAGARALHVAGYFVLPGLLDASLAHALSQAQANGIETMLDVVESPAMKDPGPLWPCFPYLDLFLCNALEAEILTGQQNPHDAARLLIARGLKRLVIKLGSQGCLLQDGEQSRVIPVNPVLVVDTVGGGDAFGAGLIGARLHGLDWTESCVEGHRASAQVVGSLGAVSGWEA